MLTLCLEAKTWKSSASPMEGKESRSSKTVLLFSRMAKAIFFVAHFVCGHSIIRGEAMEKFHLVGIKGTGMSALAGILHDLGTV